MKHFNAYTTATPCLAYEKKTDAGTRGNYSFAGKKVTVKKYRDSE
jgi:hypothetical protein